MRSKITRRKFIGEISALGSVAAITPEIMAKSSSQKLPIIKPPALKTGDYVGLVSPASGAFEPRDIRSGKETLESLGFKVEVGKYITQRNGYLAGDDKQRADDLHRMFKNHKIKAIFSLRGGYGSMRILNFLDYNLIKENPKIVLGYSDITSLHLAIHSRTGLVTFHGPVATSSFTEYTQKYFFKAVSSNSVIGEIEHPIAEGSLDPTADLCTITPGKARGQLIGGNLTLLTSLLGTPYDVDTAKKIVFIEEVSEEPYAIDRMLTQLLLTGKLQNAAGIIVDGCKKCGPREFKPAFSDTFSVEEVFHDRLKQLNIPAVFGFSIGHVADKPTLPLGIEATLDADNKKLILEEAAVHD